jgi:rare lipoprotein A
MTKKSSLFIVAFVVFMWVFMPLLGTAQSPPASAGPSSGPVKGICVYYNDKFQGHPVASGEKYDKEALTAAHKTLPFGTMVKVTNLKNNKSVVVRVNDRGPHGGSKAKIIEITSRAAKEIDMIKEGKAQVQIEVVEAAKK